MKKRIGLIVNPVAGVGGKAGFKGSDGEEIQRKAFAKGIRPEAHLEARAALSSFSGYGGRGRDTDVQREHGTGRS